MRKENIKKTAGNASVAEENEPVYKLNMREII